MPTILWCLKPSYWSIGIDRAKIVQSDNLVSLFVGLCQVCCNQDRQTLNQGYNLLLITSVYTGKHNLQVTISSVL